MHRAATTVGVRVMGPEVIVHVRGGLDAGVAEVMDVPARSAPTEDTEAPVIASGVAPSPSTTSPLPPLYDRWALEIFDAPLHGEPHTTCDDCAMHPREGEALPPGTITFDETVKCCTFLPRLPSFLVGRALLDEPSDGRNTVVARIRSRAAVTPLGLGRAPAWAMRYRHTQNVFGRKVSLRCPHHLDDGRCGVWRHRESTCATWFCKHEHGARGMRAWRALHELLFTVEHHLSFWCASTLGMGDAVRALFDEGERPLWVNDATFASHLLGAQLDGGTRGRALGSSDRAAHRALWGEWAGREEEWYAECAKLVEPLTFAEVVERVTPTLDVAPLLSRARATQLAPALPERVTASGAGLVQIGELTRARVYSAYDPIELPTALAAVLPELSGRPLAEALAAIESAHALQLTPALVRQLLDFGLLSPAR